MPLQIQIDAAAASLAVGATGPAPAGVYEWTETRLTAEGRPFRSKWYLNGQWTSLPLKIVRRPQAPGVEPPAISLSLTTPAPYVSGPVAPTVASMSLVAPAPTVEPLVFVFPPAASLEVQPGLPYKNLFSATVDAFTEPLPLDATFTGHSETGANVLLTDRENVNPFTVYGYGSTWPEPSGDWSLAYRFKHVGKHRLVFEQQFYVPFIGVYTFYDQVDIDVGVLNVPAASAELGCGIPEEFHGEYVPVAASCRLWGKSPTLSLTVPPSAAALGLTATAPTITLSIVPSPGLSCLLACAWITYDVSMQAHDDFNRGSLGADWATLSGAPSILNNRAQLPTNAAARFVRSFPDRQYAQANCSWPPTGFDMRGIVGPMLRCQSDFSGYLAGYMQLGSTYYLVLLIVNAGNPSVLAFWNAGSTLSQPIVQLEADGAAIKVKTSTSHDGPFTERISITESTYQSGSAGMGGTALGYLDDWWGGDLP